MQSMQQIITNALTDAFEKAELIPTIEYDWANIGTIYGLKGTTVKRSINFRFDSEGCVISVYNSGHKVGIEHHIRYTKNSELIEGIILVCESKIFA